MSVVSVDPDVLLKHEKIQSYFKHRFLHHYAPQFVRKLGSKGDAVAVIDGFSGRPFDDKGVLGSAPVLVQLARGHTNVHVALMELRPSYLRELREYVEREQLAHPEAVMVEVLSGDTRDKLRGVVESHRNKHLLMYLDPCGYGVAFDELVTLVNSRPPRWPSTELMLNFGSGLVERIGGGFFAGTDDGGKLTSAVGGDWWMDVVEPLVSRDGDWSSALPAVIDELVRRLAKATSKHVLAVPIRSKPRQRPMFHMVCATPAGPGVFALGDSFAKAWDDWHREGLRRESIGTLFETDSDLLADATDNRGVSEAKQLLRQSVLAQLRPGGRLTVGDSPQLYAEVLGRLTATEIGQELRAMADAQLIQLDKGPRPAAYTVYPF